MIIYQIINKTNGMRYIGQTVRTLENRWIEHCSANRCYYISRSIQKYGRDNFTVEIIDHGESIEDLNNKEEFWIKFFDTLAPNGYNLREGGENRKPSVETRKKMSSIMKGRILSEEWKSKISQSNKGKKHSKEHRKKLSKAWESRVVSEETKHKMSESIKGENHPMFGKKHSEESKQKISKSKKGSVPWNKGVPRSEETKAKLSKVLKGRKMSEETRLRMSEGQKQRRIKLRNYLKLCCSVIILKSSITINPKQLELFNE